MREHSAGAAGGTQAEEEWEGVSHDCGAVVLNPEQICLETYLVATTGCHWHLWAEGRDAAKPFRMHRTAPLNTE